MSLLCRTPQQLPISRQAAAARPAAVARPVASRSVCVRAQQKPEQQQQPMAVLERASIPVSLAVAELLTHPAMVLAEEEKQPGRLFDFNLTLPAMMGQFLILMVVLDKLWFSPVGKVLDERDAVIRSKLAGVKDNSGDVDKYAQEAQEILRAARLEVQKMVASQKGAKQAELDAQYNDSKNKINREVESSIAAVERESQAMLAKLDQQVDAISSEVLSRVLPDNVKV